MRSNLRITYIYNKMLSTTGALIKPDDKDEMAIIKKQLTVRPKNSMDLGFPLPSFKVF